MQPRGDAGHGEAQGEVTLGEAAAAGDTVGAALLTYDLGRPTRFYNMLRVFNPRSPRSVGSWVLAPSGAANTGAALLGRRGGFLGAIGGLFGAVGGLLGMPLSGYTAVLIANTAVPVWNGTRRSLPLLFMASSVATAGSLLSLAARERARARRRARNAAILGALGSLAMRFAVHHAGKASSRDPEAAVGPQRALAAR